MAQPTVVAVGVDQANNAPSGNPNGPDGEVALDIEIVGAIVPGARIAVYFTANSDAGFIDAVNRAIHDDTNKPSVISISWGGPESNWTSQSQNAFDEVLQSAAAMGVTVCVASGDSGSSDGAADGKIMSISRRRVRTCSRAVEHNCGHRRAGSRAKLCGTTANRAARVVAA